MEGAVEYASNEIATLLAVMWQPWFAAKDLRGKAEKKSGNSRKLKANNDPHTRSMHIRQPPHRRKDLTVAVRQQRTGSARC